MTATAWGGCAARLHATIMGPYASADRQARLLSWAETEGDSPDFWSAINFVETRNRVLHTANISHSYVTTLRTDECPKNSRSNRGKYARRCLKHWLFDPGSVAIRRREAVMRRSDSLCQQVLVGGE